MMRRLALPLLLLLSPSAGTAAPARGGEPELQVLTNVVWVASQSNDGDSFSVRCGDRMLRVRLYLVDTPEVTLAGPGMPARVNLQRRHFGLARNEQVLEFGRQASTFSRAVLSQPFTLYTAFTDARGEGERFYAFVQTSDGRDLGTALVTAGLARAYGYGHAAPDGRPATAVHAELARAEAAARAAAVGVWKMAAPQSVVPRPGKQKPKPAGSDSLPPAAAPIVILLVLVVVLMVWAGLWA
jgi:endonuclease YncB( thermonuclease family)